MIKFILIVVVLAVILLWATGNLGRARRVATDKVNEGLDHLQTPEEKQHARADELNAALEEVEGLIHDEERELGQAQQQQTSLTAEMTAAQAHLHSVQDSVDADSAKWSDTDKDAMDKALAPVERIDGEMTRVNARIADLTQKLHDHYADFKRNKAAVDAEYEKVGKVHDTERQAELEHKEAAFGEKQEALKQKLATGNDPAAQAQGDLAAAQGEHAAHGGLNATERKAADKDDADKRAALLAKYGKPAPTTPSADQH